MPILSRLLRILLSIGLLTLATACGQKGALYLPGDEPVPGSAAQIPCRTATCKALEQKADEAKAAKTALEADPAASGTTTPTAAPASAATPESSASDPKTTLELQPQTPAQETTP